MFPFFESIRIEKGEAHLLSLHEKRMQTSLKSIGKNMLFSLSQCLPSTSFDKNNIYKLRITYNHSHFQREIIPYSPKKIKCFRLIENNNIDYAFKYSNRSNIENLYQHKEDADDIIIVKNGEITDSSFANIVFFDGNTWHTPKSPLLKGVMREYLLSQKKIKEKSIKKQDVGNYKSFMLINALLPFDTKRQLPVSVIKK